MAETIGSRAILDLSNFDANALKYISTMRKMEQASDSASSGFSRGFGGLPNVLGAARGALSSFGGVLGNIFQIASGIVAANIFGNIASSISRMAGDAISAAANFQMLGIQMQGLIAIQIAEASRPEIITQATVDITDKQAATVAKLGDKYEDAGFKLAVMQERQAKMNEKGQEGTAVYAQLSHNISELQGDMQAWNILSGEISAQKDTIVFFKELGDRTIDMKEAMRQAKGPAAELLDWISTFAIKTNFTTQNLSEMVRGFLSMGLAVPVSKSLTEALGMLAGGMGLTQAQLTRLSDNIIQTGRSMKITERDIREFGNAGLPINSVLDAMARKLGTTRQAALEFAKSGEEGVAAFRDAIVDVANNDFPDALENIAETWSVAASNIPEVIENIFGREVIQPILGDFAKILSSSINNVLEMRGEFRKLGIQISGMFRLILPEATAFGESISTLTNTVLKLFGIDMSKFDLHTFLIAARLRIEEFLVGATNFTNWINDSLPGIANWGKTFFQALGALDSGKLGEMLGPLASGLTSWITEQSGVLADNIRNNWGPAFVSWLQVDAPVLAEKLGTMLGSVTAWLLTEGITTLMDAGQDLIGALFGVGQDVQETDAGENIIDAFIKGFSKAITERKGEILASIGQVILDAIASAQTIAAGFVIVGSFAIAQILLGIQSTLASIALNISLGILSAIGAAQAIVEGFIEIGRAVINRIVSGVQEIITNVTTNISQSILDAIAAAQGIVEGFLEIGRAIINKTVSGIQELIAKVSENVSQSINDAVAAGRAIVGDFASLGSSIIQGLIDGVVAKAAEVAAAVVGVIRDAFGAGQAESDSHSPSRKAARLLGRPIPLGMEKGILSGLPNVVRATRTVMMAAVSPQMGGSSSNSTVNNYTDAPTFSLGGVKTQATAQQVIGNFAVMQAMAGV